jgi:sugar phosphate isomerase/epimerase
MRFVYFTKLLKGMSFPETAAFLKEAGVSGADLTVRPGFPVAPADPVAKFQEAVAVFRDHGLSVPLVSAPTDFIDPRSSTARNLFENCGKVGVEYIKIGYFSYKGGPYEQELAYARRHLKEFAELARQTGVRALYHTHSGPNLGSNGESMRALLADLDPHFVGAYIDTGHQAFGGAPFSLAVDAVAEWFAAVAIKDALWERTKTGWKRTVLPAGEGFVHWADVAKTLKRKQFNGVVSLHGEYETANVAERLAKAKAELAFLRKQFA